MDRQPPSLEQQLHELAITTAVQAETLSRLTEILDEHMKRWAASEARIEHLEKRWEAHLGKVEGFITTFKLLGWLVGISWVVMQIVQAL